MFGSISTPKDQSPTIKSVSHLFNYVRCISISKTSTELDRHATSMLPTIGETLAAECLTSNKFLDNADDHFFQPMWTLFIAVAVVSAYMWARRALKCTQLFAEGVLMAEAKVLERVLQNAAKLPLANQFALKKLLEDKLGAKCNMPKMPNFEALIEALARPKSIDTEVVQGDVEKGDVGRIDSLDRPPSGTPPLGTSMDAELVPDKEEEGVDDKTKDVEMAKAEAYFSQLSELEPVQMNKFAEVVWVAKADADRAFDLEV